ncbi:MAG: hypothetical protein R2748_01010 [Bryobacterales bacterium]
MVRQGSWTACIAHYGWSAYALGTGGDGSLTPAGRELVKEFGTGLGLILDLVHTADTALDQALEIYQVRYSAATATAVALSTATASSPTTRSAGSSNATA